MDQRTLSRIVAGSVVLAALGAGPASRAARPAPLSVDFARDVAPLLERECVSCHRAGKVKGGLTLTSRADALRGGTTGPAIVPGQSAQSLLIVRLRETPDDPAMPPEPKAPLSDAEVALLRAWIDEGAVWPETAAAAAPAAASDPSDPSFAAVHDLFQSRCVRCHGAGRRRRGCAWTRARARCAAARGSGGRAGQGRARARS